MIDFHKPIEVRISPDNKWIYARVVEVLSDGQAIISWQPSPMETYALVVKPDYEYVRNVAPYEAWIIFNKYSGKSWAEKSRPLSIPRGYEVMHVSWAAP